jgi:hypothetical protein
MKKNLSLILGESAKSCFSPKLDSLNEKIIDANKGEISRHTF